MLNGDEVELGKLEPVRNQQLLLDQLPNERDPPLSTTGILQLHLNLKILILNILRTRLTCELDERSVVCVLLRFLHFGIALGEFKTKSRWQFGVKFNSL